LATRSAQKAYRQSLKRRIRNRAVKSSTKTAVKHAVEAIAAGDLDAARPVVRSALVALDRAAQKGIIHPNNAARRKSRLFLRYNAAVAALQAPADEKPARKTSAKSTSKSARARKGPAKKTSKK
jgi:small subunit ribosomal protein S20